MKKMLYIINLLIIFTIFFLPQFFYAQAPEKMSYQAVIRDASNLLVTYTDVCIQMSILHQSETGTPVYVETHSTMTNANGLVTLKIGSGTIVSGDFTLIDWSDGPYFVQTEIDLEGGTNYTITVTTQLLSVPFSLHSNTADSLTQPILETDPVFDTSAASLITLGDINFWNSKLDEEIDGDTTNEIQTLSIVNDTLFISEAGYVVLPAETDPVFDTSVAGGITTADTTHWGSHNDSTDIADMGYIAGGTYTVGDFVHGGIVFWVDETGKHGLVCAKEDQNDGDMIRWYAGTFGYTRATGDGPYSGELNTAIIISSSVAIGDDGALYAARVINNAQITENGTTYGDWYMPSKTELKEMYDNRSIINATATANGGSSFQGYVYWSSTEYDNDDAWGVRFDMPLVGRGGKEYAGYIRAVRAF